MASVFGSLISNYGPLKTFATQCDCLQPSITTTVLSNSSVKLDWIDDTCSINHRIQYKNQLQLIIQLKLFMTVSVYLIQQLLV